MMQSLFEKGKGKTCNTIRIVAGVWNKVQLMCWNKCVLAFSGINVYLMVSFLIAISWEELSLAAFQIRDQYFPFTSVFTRCIFFFYLLMYFALSLNLDI